MKKYWDGIIKICYLLICICSKNILAVVENEDAEIIYYNNLSFSEIIVFLVFISLFFSLGIVIGEFIKK